MVVVCFIGGVDVYYGVEFDCGVVVFGGLDVYCFGCFVVVKYVDIGDVEDFGIVEF